MLECYYNMFCKLLNTYYDLETRVDYSINLYKSLLKCKVTDRNNSKLVKDTISVLVNIFKVQHDKFVELYYEWVPKEM
jgi:hypothetical protein